MARAFNDAAAHYTDALPNFPVSLALWEAMVAHIGLSPREAEVAAHKLCGSPLKTTAARLGIEIASVRSFQDRILVKARIQRHEFFAYMLRVSHEVQPCTCPQKCGHETSGT